MKPTFARRIPAPGAALALASALLLAGCVNLGGGKPPARLIGLTAQTAAPAGALVSGTADDVLLVLDPDTDRRLDVRRVAVQVDDSNVAYLQKAMWVERPARLFRHLLAETIRAGGKQLVMEDNDEQAPGKSTLSGRLIDMGYDARTRSVVVRYDALRRKRGGAIEARRFEAIVPGVAPRAKAVGPALNKAANDVARQVADWVG